MVTGRRIVRGAAWLIGAALAAGCTGESVVGRDAGSGIDAVVDATPSCTAPQTLCGGRCVDPQTDSANCGACGMACAAGTVCSAGTCQVRCPAGATVCAGTCVNAQTDNANCGACGRACSAGQVCSLGVCGTTCAAMLATCGGGDAGAAAPFCADLANDRLNCGACGNACPAGSICVGRACAVSCAAGQTQCGNACVDLQTSNANCGACGTACAAGTTCTAGACAVSCGAGLTQCGATCVNTQTDNANCGACGTTCPAGQVCSGGACSTTCAAPLTTCTGTGGTFCASTGIDPANCGACGAACALANVAANGCTAGACGVVRCAANFGDCDGAAANGCEVDTRTTVAHCGGCGRACNLPHATSNCNAGACGVASCATGFRDCDLDPSNGCEVNVQTENANCGACGTTCAAGQVCSMGACGTTCASPLVTCTAGGVSACANTANDPANCGACGNACALAGASANGCAGGACTVLACNAGLGNCDGMAANGCETSLATSAANCGACGRACALPNATATCAAGACAVTTCAAGFRDCNTSAADGCEVNTRTDNANCGACGTTCAAGQVCSAGACVTTCAAPLTVCSGGCVNTTNDPAHCGSCTTVCPTAPNTVPVCAAGTCAFVCAPGFGDCDRNPTNGCEVNLATTVAHCGACGAACPARANAASTCAGSTCGYLCATGAADCDGMAANGCEVNTATSVANCGACGTACPTYANASPTCVASACGSACSAGFGDCDGNPLNGCTSLQADPMNCGGCGVVCAAGRPCTNGVCLNATSCRSIKQTNPSAADGVYTIDPDGVGGGAPFNVYCEMTTDGGGWTVMAYIRSNAQWDIGTFSNTGTVGDVAGGFSQGGALAASAATFTERIVIYRNLVEMGGSLGLQWMETYRSDNNPVRYTQYNVDGGWGYRDSFGYADTTVNSICSHGCTTFRGLGMFHDYESSFGYCGTQTGNYGCRDGNNICWMPRSGGCNVGDTRCAYLTGTGEGTIYAGR